MKNKKRVSVLRLFNCEARKILPFCAIGCDFFYCHVDGPKPHFLLEADTILELQNFSGIPLLPEHESAPEPVHCPKASALLR